MPIFDKELIDNTREDDSLEAPDPVLGSIEGTKLNMNLGGALYEPTQNRGFGLDEIRQVSGTPMPKGFGQTFTYAPKSELLANQRYPVYERGVDLENIYGLQQTWYQQLGNGVAKLGGNLVGTFAQSLTNIPNTISAAKNLDFAKLSGDPNGYEGTIDNWMRNMDDFLPNYMTRYERDHPFSTAIPFFRGSANWWGGKFLPNLGFMGGAVLGAVVQDVAIGMATEGIGEIPLVAAQIGKASLYLNKLFTGTNAAERVAKLATTLGKTESQILNMTKLAQLSAAAKVGSGFRYGTAIIASAMTEAGVESRDAYRQVKEELTKQYVAENGKEPDFNAAQQIENSATNAMNARFGINMALLVGSNTLQFGNAFRSMTAARGAVTQLDDIGKIGLAEGSIDVFEKKVAKTVAGKVWESVKPGVGNIFREGVFEEGGQFAAERGTYDYYTRKYKSDKYKETWSDLNEVIKSTAFGMKEQFGSQEGIENMLIGGLTGLLIGKVQSLYENKKGIGNEAKIGSALNILNRFGITNTLQRQYDSTATQAGIAKDMQEAAKSGDVFKYKNLQEDGFFDFVSYRLPSGMHDVTLMQLEMLKDLPKDQFEQMFQLDFNESNKSTVNQYVDTLIDRANDIKKTTDAINSVYRNPFKNNPKEGDIESQVEADNYTIFENYKLDLSYYASIAPSVNRRLSSIQQDVNAIVPGVSNDMLSMLTSDKGLKSLSEMYEQKANQLNASVTEFTSVQDRINTKNQVIALRTRSERIAMALGEGKMNNNLFQDLLNFEINGQDATKDNIIPIEQVTKLREYGYDVERHSDRKQQASKAYDELSTREGFEKYVEQAEQMASDREAVAEEEEKETKSEEQPVVEKKEPVYKNKAGVEEKLEKGREYQIPKAKVASIKKLADDRWEVSYPGGTTKFYKSQEDAKLAADDINTRLGNLQKVKVLGFNEDGSIKVENLKGDIFNIQPSRLEGYEKLETKEEKFSKAAGDINRQQEELEKKSGDVGVGEQTNTEVSITPIYTGPEGKLKAASRFFASSTGPSEAKEDVAQASPHLIRSRVFMNNVKNFKNRNKLRAFMVTPSQISALGLDGLLQMQYNKTLDTPLSEIPDTANVDLGLVAQVFVEEDGGKLYFVDEKGERISEVNGQQTDMSRIVFKPMPTTDIYYNYTDPSGARVPRFRSGEQEAFEAYSKSWRVARTKMFKASAFPIKLYKFSVSRGIRKEIKIDDQIQRNQVGGILIPENKIATQEGLIIVPKEDFISHQGDNIGWTKGSPALQNGDTLEYINNTKFSANKAKSVYQVFKALADDVMKQYEAGKGIKINAAYISYLQNVLYYLSKGGTPKAKSNQFFIDTANMSISFGGETYKLDEIDQNESKMVEQLKNTFHNLNSFTLKDSFYSPFYEYVYEDGALKEVEWVNYQSYLLSSKNPDGKSRGTADTPFLTNVAPPTPAVPYSFEQKSATMIDFEFPPIEMPKAPPAAQAAPGTVKIGEYDMSGKGVVNQFPSSFGPISFTGKIVDGIPAIEVIENDTVRKVAEDSEFVQGTVIPKLKELGQFNEKASDVQLVADWMQLNIESRLRVLQEEAPKEEVVITPAETTAATFTPTTPYGTLAGAPLTTAVSDNKADIERKKLQEELYKLIAEKPSLKREDLPDEQLNTLEGTATQKLADFAAEIYDVPKINVKDGKYTSWFQGLSNAGYNLTFKLNGPKLVYDILLKEYDKLKELKINRLNKELAALEGATPVEDVSKQIAELEKEIEYKQRRLQELEIMNEVSEEEFSNRYLYIANNLPKIKPASAKKETGAKTGSGKDINSSLLNSKTGVSVERAAEMIYSQGQSENSGLDLSEDFVRNEIIELLQIGKEAYKKMHGKVSKSEVSSLKKDIDSLIEKLNTLQKSGGKFDVNDALSPNNYMRIGVNEDEAPMTDAEFELFKQWHAESASGIPFEVLDNVVVTYDNEKSFGVFENGVAKFHKLAPGTAPYHEVGEGIWNAFLTPEQRQILIDEFKAKSGQFTDRASRKEIYYADATDQQAKERILDDYAEFRAGKIKAKSLGQRVLAFFKSIMEFFKSFVQKPSMKEQLFKAIDAGKFKNYKVSEEARKAPPEYMRIPGLTEIEAHDFVQDMVIRSGRILFGGSKKFIYKLNPLTGRDVFNTIEQDYIRENKKQQMSDVTWNMLKKRTIDSLRTIGVNYNEEDLVNINAEGTTGLGYAPEPFSVNWKKYSPFPIKFLAFSTLKAKPTNQQSSTSLKIPEIEESTSVKGLIMVGYGKVMSTLFNKLSNTTDPKLMGKKLAELARYDADFVRFFQSIGGNLDSGEVDFSEFKDADWRLFIQFFQTFSLQKPEAYIQYVTGSQVYTRPANQFTAAKDIENGWYEGIRTLSGDKDSLVVRNRVEKIYEIKPNNFPKELPKKPEDQTAFLKKLGIIFDISDYANLKEKDQEKFSEEVGKIYTYLKEKGKIGKITGAEMGINSQISALANLLITSTNPIQESTYPGVEGERVQSNTQNNYFSVFENEFNNAETLEELLVVRPELKDIFSRNSVALMDNGLLYKSDGTRMKLLKVSYIQGERDNISGVGKKTGSLTLGKRMTQEINQNLNGQYYILLPADSATEWMLNLGNYIKFEDITSDRAWNRLYKVFKGYLIDDINLALDWENRSKIKNVGDKAKELRFFKDVLSTYDKEGNLVPSAILTEINRRIEEGQSIDKITEYINDKEVASKIDEMVKASVDENVAATREALISEGEIVTLPKSDQEAPTTYAYGKLDNDFVNNKNVSLDKFKLSNEDVNNVLTFARMNYMIANIEFHKILFGDPYQFKVKGDVYDVLKRAKSFGSPRRTTFDIAEYNAELNDVENKVGDISLDPEEIGYHLYKDYARTVTFADVEFSTKDYPEVNEADGDSWLMDAAYKELKLKNAQWPEEAEAFHQWQMAYTRQNMPGYQYQSEDLRKLDIELLKKPEPVFVIEKLKPVVTGSKAGSTNIDLILDKFAQLPIYYKAVQRTNLAKLYEKMWKEKADYGIMISGRKLGALKELHSLYKGNKFNEDAFNNFIDVPWDALGIQVENSFEHEKDQTWGSQPSKISSMDFFDNGQEAIPGAKKTYDEYIDATKRYHLNKYQQLLKKLGLQDLGNGFKLTDTVAIAETLEGELFRRQLSESVKYAIQLDENKQFPIPFEASTNYNQIKDILYSMVNKALVSPKLNGGPKPLSSVTLWEKGDRDPNAANPELKFYDENNAYVGILLPYKYRSKFSKKRFPTDDSVLEYLNNTDEGRMVKGVMFRIPCDAQNKIDTYKIKGFLPNFMDVVIGPSELVAKDGLDFDFDKQSMYLKSVYVDRKGDVRLVRYLGSEETTKEFFGKLFDDKLEKKKVSKAEILEALQILDLGLDDPNDLVDKYSELLDILLEDATPEERADTLLKELEKLGDANLQAALKQRYIEDMYNRALENDYFQAMENMLTLPGNYERRIVPTNDAGLKEEAKDIKRLRGKAKETIKNRILNGAFMTATRHFFVMGKKWIGIVATNITSHAQFQKTQVTLDPSKIKDLPEFQRGILGDGSVILPHNTVKINGEDRLSLSGTKTADGKNLYISDRLAGYGTAVVDIVKDNFITDIIYSDLLISPVMLLERMGSGEYVSKFVNQPIVRKYISYIESKGEKGLLSKKNVDHVKQFFPAVGVAINKIGIDVNNFDKNIENGADNSLTYEQNAEQQNILDEFLKYVLMAQYSFKLTQAINYDTSKSRNSDSFSRRQTKTDIANQKNIFCCAEDILKSTFVENQRELIDYAMSAMGEIIKTEKDEYRIITDSILTPYEEVDFMMDEDFERIASKLKASFVDYIIQTKTKINEELEALTLGEDSVANQLEQAKKKYPNVKILKELQVARSVREGGAQSVKLRTKITDPVDIDIYIERMRELNDADPQLFNNIVKIAIIQGNYDSNISIKNIIPPEYYSEIVKPIIDSLAPTLDVKAFKNGSFQRNNWKDDDVVPMARVNFSIDPNVLPSEYQDVDYYTYRSPSFVGIEGLKITDKFDRRVMLLSPKYNASDIQYDFLKIPRIVTINASTGEKIDFKTGKTITDSAIYNRRNSGDFSVDDIYLYEKVKDGLGNAVTTFDGRYVYKLTSGLGDGQYATEHYPDNRPSIYNNGSVQIDNEIPNADIINYYGGVVKAEKEALPSQPVEQTSAAVSEINKSVADVPQNKVSGVESYGSLVTANDEVIKALGPNPHSIDMIEAGFRKRTTRSESEMAKYAIKVGDIIKNYGKSADNTTKTIYARVTAIYPKGSIGWKSTWYNEGWRADDVKVIDKFKDGAAAIEFEVIKPTQPATSKGLSTPSGKITLRDGKEYLISDVNTQLLQSIGYKPKEIGKLLKSIIC